MATTALWALIEEWRDAQLFHVSQAALASKVGVTRSALSQWKSGQAKPTPESLQKIANVTRIPYNRLLHAVLIDMGYLDADLAASAHADRDPVSGERVTVTEGLDVEAGSVERPSTPRQALGRGTRGPEGVQPLDPPHVDEDPLWTDYKVTRTKASTGGPGE